MAHCNPDLAATTSVMPLTLSVVLRGGRGTVAKQGGEGQREHDRQPGGGETTTGPGGGGPGHVGGGTGPQITQPGTPGHHHGEDALQPSAQPVGRERLQDRLPVDGTD